MRNYIMLICLLFLSCASFVDVENERNDYFELLSFDDYNIFKKINQVGVSMDTVRYDRKDFEVKLPKNIIYYKTGTYNIFEYSSKQIIVITSGEGKSKESTDWKFKKDISDDILNFLDKYWTGKGYNFNYLEKSKKGRVSKIYSNQNTNILLFNIKDDNFEHFYNYVKKFKYLSNTKK